MALARLARLRGSLAEKGLDALLVVKPENRAYLSSFTGTAGALLITPERAWLLTDFRYEEQAAAQAPDFEVHKVSGTYYGSVSELLEQAGAIRVGYEGDFLPVDEFNLYRDVLTGHDLVSASGLTEEQRMVKDESELETMRRAAAITDEAFSQILSYIKPGVKERDVAVELEYRMKKLGAEGLAFEIIVASGVRSSLPHGIASEKLIEQGDLVTLDFGAKYQGYCSDMTRTVMVGEPTAQQREIYNIVLEAQQRGVAACKAGLTGAEVDEVCRGYIRERGYAEQFGHGTGHGVGRYIHEGPRLNARGTEQLKPGTIVTIEPGIYLPGWGGVRIEDMVMVTETGCERLSRSPKELIVL